MMRNYDFTVILSGIPRGGMESKDLSSCDASTVRDAEEGSFDFAQDDGVHQEKR